MDYFLSLVVAMRFNSAVVAMDDGNGWQCVMVDSDGDNSGGRRNMEDEERREDEDGQM